MRTAPNRAPRVFLVSFVSLPLLLASRTFGQMPDVSGAPSPRHMDALAGSIDCTGAVPEGEPCGTDINGGCHGLGSELYSGLECGMTICGELFVDDEASFDVDWYTLNLLGSGPTTKVIVTLQSAMPVQLLVVNDDCADIRVLRAGVGDPLQACVCLPAGVYRIFVAPAVEAGFPCSAAGREYLLSVDCLSVPERECCDDESIEVDAMGEPILPSDWDGTPPETIDVDLDRGRVPDLYPQFDTSIDLWYDAIPCPPVIGDHVDAEDEADDPEDDLASIGVIGDEGEILDDLAAWGAAIAAQGATEPDSLATATPVVPAPFTPTAAWCPPPGEYVFGGRDIVLVHGLRLEHLVDRFTSVPGAEADWIPPTVFPGKIENPEFYTGGYYHGRAAANWSDYVSNFLQAAGAQNRYLIVCYQSSGRLETAVHSVLTQIADAMRTGEGVIDLSGCDDTDGFGSRSFVVLTHSTGALVTDAAMHAAATKPNLGAAFIPQFCKAHVAPSGAFIGSNLATTAVGLSGYVTINPVTWSACMLAKRSLEAIDPSIALPNCGNNPGDLDAMIAALVGGSILVDLVPENAQAKWGPSVAATPVRTITAVAGHPTKNAPLKFLLHRGIDDGVVNINSQVASPNPVAHHPSGFFPDRIREVFDLGVKHALLSPKRAKKYYKDQKRDRENPNGMAAAGATRFVSTTGMLQPAGLPIFAVRDPHARTPNHLSFLQSAASHPTAIRAMTNYPFYEETPTLPFGAELNWEETRVLTDHAVYDQYAAGLGDIAPLLSSTCMKPLREGWRGKRLVFRLRIFGKTFRRELWIWKRTYHLLEDSHAWHQVDFIHHSVLCTPLDCTQVPCDPTPCPGDIDLNGVVDVLDLLAVLSAWGQIGGDADVTFDGVVNFLDLLTVLSVWGEC